MVGLSMIRFPHVVGNSKRESGDIFVTGATGFLGPVLVSEMLKQYPYEVVD